mmetsp:Transcript_39833/g.83740  ORF Transcript_39833/g.83740 Transcript_39833/m.83740 type:complete len:86 (-) Transcript_39833:1132-1389(-)
MYPIVEDCVSNIGAKVSTIDTLQPQIKYTNRNIILPYSTTKIPSRRLNFIPPNHYNLSSIVPSIVNNQSSFAMKKLTPQSEVADA